MISAMQCPISQSTFVNARTRFIYRGAPADIFTEFIFGKQFNFIDDEDSTRGLYDREHEVLFGMFHLGRHIYFLIPLLCDLLWQKIKQVARGTTPKWSMLGYLSVRKCCAASRSKDIIAYAIAVDEKHFERASGGTEEPLQRH